MIRIDREALAWAAGFFDGEGSMFVVRRNGRPSISIAMKIAQVHTEVLERFQAAAGGLGRVAGPYSYSDSRDVYVWECAKFEHVQTVLALIWPWLGTVKRQQAIRVVRELHQWWATPGYKPHHQGRSHCQRGHPFAGEHLGQNSRGKRICKTCQQAAQKRYHDRETAKRREAKRQAVASR